ncbi:MAG: hypothetical protein NZ866_02630 [Patescibacteria group bacterium]|nr:hypothetical protein [Patescibacteria group bacterium]
MNRNKFYIIVCLIFSLFIFSNLSFSQSQSKFTLFKTDNYGFKFITNQLIGLEFKLSSDDFSSFLNFGYTRAEVGLNNSTISSKFIIRPSHYGGSYLYSITPNNYGGERYTMINLRPFNSSTIFIFNDTAREGMERLAKIYTNLESAIAIYSCSPNSWLYQNPRYTCLGKYGYYSDRLGSQPPPGASSTNYYDRGARIYINPSNCFGNNQGRVLQEICTGDCTRGDDSALTICVLDKIQ